MVKAKKDKNGDWWATFAQGDTSRNFQQFIDGNGIFGNPRKIAQWQKQEPDPEFNAVVKQSLSLLTTRFSQPLPIDDYEDDADRSFMVKIPPSADRNSATFGISIDETDYTRANGLELINWSKIGFQHIVRPNGNHFVTKVEYDRLTYDQSADRNLANNQIQTGVPNIRSFRGTFALTDAALFKTDYDLDDSRALGIYRMIMDPPRFNENPDHPSITRTCEIAKLCPKETTEERVEQKVLLVGLDNPKGHILGRVDWIQDSGKFYTEYHLKKHGISSTTPDCLRCKKYWYLPPGKKGCTDIVLATCFKNSRVWKDPLDDSEALSRIKRYQEKPVNKVFYWAADVDAIQAMDQGRSTL